MQYRIKEVIENGHSLFYPQYKKRWFWRRFVWFGGEDGFTPYGVAYSNYSSALAHIEGDKNRKHPEPRKIIYHEA